jgi:MYXO-CTERM domain-containing protein
MDGPGRKRQRGDEVCWRSACAALCLSAIVSIPASRAVAHGGVPALAVLEAGSKCARAEDVMLIRWTEPEVPSVFGESIVEIYTTTTSTRPLYFRERPRTTWVLRHRVSDADPSNSFAWPTSGEAAGHYFFWSHIVEPAQENADYVAHQAGFVVSVRDEGPTVMLDRPASFSASFGSYRVTYIACSTSTTARVRLDGAREEAPDTYFVLADDLPAVEDGTFDWNTRALTPGRWILRATITDGCGRGFTSHARGFVEVRAAVDPVDGGASLTPVTSLDAAARGDSACVPAGPGLDASTTMPDAALTESAVDACARICEATVVTSSGCDCSTHGTGTRSVGLWTALIALALRRVRRTSRAAIRTPPESAQDLLRNVATP